MDYGLIGYGLWVGGGFRLNLRTFIYFFEIMKIYIKNMVCNRCKMVLEAELQKLGIAYHKVELGEVELQERLTAEKQLMLEEMLKRVGFEWLKTKKEQAVEGVKNLIVNLVHVQDNQLEGTLSAYLAQNRLQNYALLSSWFSEQEGQTIEQFYIAQKIERVKELLMYDELTLSELAFKLGYSSVGHLSNQFKKVTGESPTVFKRQKKKDRTQLDLL